VEEFRNLFHPQVLFGEVDDSGPALGAKLDRHQSVEAVVATLCGRYLQNLRKRLILKKNCAMLRSKGRIGQKRGTSAGSTAERQVPKPIFNHGGQDRRIISDYISMPNKNGGGEHGCEKIS
jgi:hypothetical protein